MVFPARIQTADQIDLGKDFIDGFRQVWERHVLAPVVMSGSTRGTHCTDIPMVVPIVKISMIYIKMLHFEIITLT